MDNWFTKITYGFFKLIHDSFIALYDLFIDFFLSIIDLILSAIAGVLNSIPVPDFLTNVSISSLINQLPPFALYIANHMHIGAAFAVLLSGVIFRLTRKFFTLGQW